MKSINLFLMFFLFISQFAAAETDGTDLLELMRYEKSREAVQPFIDDVWQKWNNGIFCVPEDDIQNITYNTVKTYLENNPQNLFRPRRYLIIQALRADFPCSKD